MERDPLKLTIADWNRMSAEEKEEAREQVRKAATRLRTIFLTQLGYVYILVCGSVDDVAGACRNMLEVTEVAEVVQHTETFDTVPFEFFSDSIPEETVNKRWEELNRALAEVR